MSASLKNSITLCLTVLLMSLADPAFAESAAKKTVDADVDYKKIESMGLYAKRGEGGLGKDLWKGSKRSNVIRYIKAMPVASPSPTMQKLISGVLLSQTNAGLIENDVPPKAGRDLFTLRIEKLLQGGAHEQAFSLYSTLDDDPYHDRLARAGIAAMLFAGQKSLACLDVKTFQERFSGPEFWATMGEYCGGGEKEQNEDDPAADSETGEATQAAKESKGSSILNALATNDSYVFEYSTDDFSKLSLLERAALTAEKAIKITALDVEAIQPEHIQPLLSLDGLSEEHRLALTTKAVRYGLLPSKRLEEIYTAMAAPAAGKDAAEAPEPKSDWHKLAYYYQTASSSENDQAKWENIRKALPLAKNHSIASLLPFADMTAKIKPEEPATLEEIATVFRLLNYAGKNIPDTWQNKLENLDSENLDKNLYFKTLIAGFSALPESKKTAAKTAQILDAAQKTDIHSQQYMNNIIENLDKPSDYGNNATTIYEKDFYLTYSKDYVMPSMDVWDRLKITSNSNVVGETILLNTILFRDRASQEIYPGLLQDIRKSFENVGLTKVSKDLVMEASLEDK